MTPWEASQGEQSLEALEGSGTLWQKDMSLLHVEAIVHSCKQM